MGISSGAGGIATIDSSTARHFDLSSSYETAEFDDSHSYLGEPWQNLKRSERSNSVQSCSNSSTRESVWKLDFMEHDPVHVSPPSAFDIAVSTTPPLANYNVPNSRPALRPSFVKANSYSEGVNDFDEMSHYLSSSASSAHPHLHHTAADFSPQRRLQNHVQSHPKPPHVLQSRKALPGRESRPYSRPALPFELVVPSNDCTLQAHAYEDQNMQEFLFEESRYGHGYSYDGGHGYNAKNAQTQDYKRHHYLSSQNPDLDTCQHCQNNQHPHPHPHPHPHHHAHSHFHPHSHRHQQQQHQLHHSQYQQYSRHYQSHEDVSHATLTHNSQSQLPSNESTAYAPWQVTPTSSLSDVPRMDYFEEMPGQSSLDAEGKFESLALDSSPPPSTQSSISSALFADTTTTVPDITGGNDPGNETIIMPENADLENRFYQSFNNSVQRSSGSKHESVYEQLINDKPLMEALSKRVKRGYYRCAHCPKMFSSLLDYAKHIDEFQIQRDYKCPFVLCPWKILGLPRRPELRRHCAIQHKMEIPLELKSLLKLGDSDFPIMECPSPYCDKTFFRRDSYARHVAMVHDKLDSRFNKRLNKLLEDCPYPVGTQEHIDYVLEELTKTKRGLKP
ncbi:LAFA_0C08372g1_1 [Lachancea sp. 'fantastica']|nr:LAFA_0C08372g1_1 [Lachancea sp. 'fantastica']